MAERLGSCFSPRVDFRLDEHARSSCHGVLIGWNKLWAQELKVTTCSSHFLPIRPIHGSCPLRYFAHFVCASAIEDAFSLAGRGFTLSAEKWIILRAEKWPGQTHKRCRAPHHPTTPHPNSGARSYPLFGAQSEPMVLKVIRCSKLSTFRCWNWSLYLLGVLLSTRHNCVDKRKYIYF